MTDAISPAGDVLVEFDVAVRKTIHIFRVNDIAVFTI